MWRPRNVRRLTMINAGSAVRLGRRTALGTVAFVGGTAVALHHAVPTACNAAPKLERRLSENAQSRAAALGEIVKHGRIDWALVRRLLVRCAELCFCLGPILGGYLLHQTPLLGSLIFPREWLLDLIVRCLASCGPVGIKWGQWASTRYDLFEEDMCIALNTLTNHAPAHSYEHSALCIERSFNRRVDELFDSFDRKALASGSIGQVHIGTLRGSGTEVAIKVQHPNLPERLFLDMTILRRVAYLAAKLAPGMRVGETVDQFASNFECQLDFRDEARNLYTFRSNFGGAFWSSVVSFPQPVEGLVSQEVLVESFEEGESVAAFLMQKGERKPGVWHVVDDPSSAYGTKWVMVGAEEDESTDLRCKVGVVGLQTFLKMLIWDNLMHADLHPGNVLIRMEEASPLARLQRYLVLGDASARVPHVIFLDAGLAASFNPDIYANVRKFFDAIIADDGVAYGKSILGLGASQPYVKDPDAFVAEVSAMTKKQRAEFDAGGGRSGDNIREYMAAVRKHRVVIDPSVMVALMSMVVLEGWQVHAPARACACPLSTHARRASPPHGVQYRLDPSISVIQSLEAASTGGVFGCVSRLNNVLQSFLRLVGWSGGDNLALARSSE